MTVGAHYAAVALHVYIVRRSRRLCSSLLAHCTYVHVYIDLHLFFYFLIFYFSSQDAQANLPSRRGRDVLSSHKKRIWCDDRKKEEREETQPRAEQEASMRKRKGQKVLNESEPQEARRCKKWGQ